MGMYFSRRKLRQPLPPLPAWTAMGASSTNFTGLSSRKSPPSVASVAKGGPRGRPASADPPNEKSPASGASSRSVAASGGDDVDVLAVVRAPGHELHLAVGGGEEGVIAAHADVDAGVNAGAALTDDDVARQNLLAAKALDAKAFAFGVASVTGAATSFLVCHEPLLLTMSGPASASLDTGDFDFSEPLAVALLLAEVVAAASSGDPRLVAATVAVQLGGDAAAVHVGCAVLDAVGVGDHQHLVKADGLAGGDFKLFESGDFALHHAVVLATAGYF